MTFEHELHGIIASGIEVKLPRYSQIDGRLWIGAQPPVQAPQHFDFIVNLAPGMAYALHRHQVQVCHVMYDDGHVPAQKPIGAILGLLMQFLAAGMTLIHCRDGLNRSAYVAALVLIGRGLAPASAIELLRAKRHREVLCNRAFEGQLLDINREKVRWNAD